MHTITQINNTTKDSLIDPFGFMDNPNPQTLPPEDKSSIQDLSISPFKDKKSEPFYRRELPESEFHFLSPPTLTTIMDTSIPRIQQSRPVTHHPSSEVTRASARRLTPLEKQNYQLRVWDLAEKIKIIMGVNEDLERKIEAQEEENESKVDENRRINKKVAELGQRIKEEEQSIEELENRVSGESGELEANLLSLKRRCESNTVEVQASLMQERARVKAL